MRRLEEGKVPLEELIAIYERGEALKRRCEELLRQAEARVEKITLDAARQAERRRAAGRRMRRPRASCRTSPAMTGERVDIPKVC